MGKSIPVMVGLASSRTFLDLKMPLTIVPAHGYVAAALAGSFVV